MSFIALDVETASRDPSSICAISIVRVTNYVMDKPVTRFIRPFETRFDFTYLHGLSWEYVRSMPNFTTVWKSLVPRLESAILIAAHNAQFDRRALAAACRRCGLPMIDVPFVCTMRLARRIWGIFPTRLPDVCRILEIPLDHHQVESDALACANIVRLAVEEIGLQRVLELGR